MNPYFDPAMESATPTAVSSQSSLHDAEKGYAHMSKDKMAQYIVPVLEKGVRSALIRPVSRWTKFRIWYNPYRQLFSITFVANIITLILASIGHFSYAHDHAAAFALGNILAAVSVRNELLLRGLFWLLVKLFQKWTPLSFRIFLTAFLQHLGGIHSGTALSGLCWLLYSITIAFIQHRENHVVVLVMSVFVTLFIAITIISALPPIRERHHNVFEHHHRFAGWLGLAFTWTFVVLSVSQVPITHGDGVKWHWSGQSLAESQQFWFAAAITILIFIPWFTVRKVPVEVIIPSQRVAIVKFQRGIQQGLLGRISRDGIREYHGFGIISEGVESNCHYMIVGVQGDWTRSIVNDPPKALYTREMKFAGLPYLAHLYRRGIMICTGSGIGAVLSTCVQLDNWFLIWIGSDLEGTFSRVLLDMIERRIPKERYILFDTKKEGRRPDTVRMLKDIYKAFEAEVVIITSNPKGNEELMQACRENNMHSFGPLWDS